MSFLSFYNYLHILSSWASCSSSSSFTLLLFCFPLLLLHSLASTILLVIPLFSLLSFSLSRLPPLPFTISPFLPSIPISHSLLSFLYSSLLPVMSPICPSFSSSLFSLSLSCFLHSIPSSHSAISLPSLPPFLTSSSLRYTFSLISLPFPFFPVPFPITVLLSLSFRLFPLSFSNPSFPFGPSLFPSSSLSCLLPSLFKVFFLQSFFPSSVLPACLLASSAMPSSHFFHHPLRLAPHVPPNKGICKACSPGFENSGGT